MNLFPLVKDFVSMRSKIIQRQRKDAGIGRKAEFCLLIIYFKISPPILTWESIPERSTIVIVPKNHLPLASGRSSLAQSDYRFGKMIDNMAVFSRKHGI